MARIFIFLFLSHQSFTQMNKFPFTPVSTFFLFSLFILIFYNSDSLAQTYNDGPIELKTRVREVKVEYSPPADASLNFGGQVGFNPDEFTFKVWSQDNGNFSGLGWQGGTCLTDDFDPPLASTDFNYMLFNYIYPTPSVPQFFEIRLDAWQDNCGSDGGSVGFPCPGGRCSFDATCCCVDGGFFGCLFNTSDNNHCDANPFKTQVDYRLGPPCQWYSHGFVSSTGCTIYEPHIESYWKYTRGISCDTAITLGNIVPGGQYLSHYNSNECYSNNYPSSPGNDVFYEFTITQPIGLKISLCAAAAFKTNLYLLDGTCAQIAFNDSFCSNTSEIQTAICIPGTYYIIVDGDSTIDMGTFTLTVSEDTSQIVKANAGNNKMICFGTSSTLGGSPAATGGVPPYTYQWSPTAFLSDPDTANPQAYPPPGIAEYILSVTDSAGCVVTDTVPVTVNPGPDIELGNDTTICNKDTITLDAGTGYLNYFWSNGASTTSINAYLSTLYFVSVFDLFGCIGTDTLLLSFHPSFLLDLGNDTGICAGESIIFNAGNFENYLWNTGDTNLAITVNSAGNFSVEVTDTNGCSYNDTILLYVNPNPIFSLGNDTSICPEANLELDPGGGYTSYLWNDNSIDQTLAATDSGTYFVKVSNEFNCFNSDTMIVSVFLKPTVNLGPDTNICLGNSMTLNAGNGFSDYLWNTTSSSSAISVISGGTYIVTVTNADGCTDADTIFINQNPALSAGASSTDVKCYGMNDGFSTISANGGTFPFSYLWSNGQTSPTATLLVNGIYSATVTDSKGCASVVTIFIDEPEQLVINSTITEPVCADVNDGKIDLSVNGGTLPYSYNWSDGNLSEDNDSLASGNFSVTISDNNNCIINQSFIINSPPSVFIDADIKDASCTGENNGSVEIQVFGGTSPYFYLWSNGETKSQILNLKSQIYSVTVTDLNGCTGKLSAKVDELKIKIDEDLISVPNVFTPNGDNANDYFKIYSEAENIADYEMTIYNRWGELIFKTNDINAKWDGKFKGKEIAEGVYFCSLQLSVNCLGNNEVITKTSSVNLIR